MTKTEPYSHQAMVELLSELRAKGNLQSFRSDTGEPVNVDEVIEHYRRLGASPETASAKAVSVLKRGYC